jgi:hypothetical protein
LDESNGSDDYIMARRHAVDSIECQVIPTQVFVTSLEFPSTGGSDAETTYATKLHKCDKPFLFPATPRD